MPMVFTCISCRVSFADADIQRQHYKTDWHRYNLKRKVVSLPPVTAEDFQQRVLLQRAKDEEDSKDTSTYCKVCRKSFASDKAFENHLNSKKHKDRLDFVDPDLDVSEPAVKTVRNTEDSDSEFEDLDSDEYDSVDDEEEISPDNPISKNNCLFCNYHSKTMTKNLKHMSVEHSFFVPDIEYIINIRGLLLYLGEKICKFYMCLWCNTSGKEFRSMEAAQKHMRDKGHCKMLHEGNTLAEYENFYNYSQSYPDHDDHMDVDQAIDSLDLDGTNYELTLPSGATIGHRTLFQYYKQSFPTCTQVVKKSKLDKVFANYRALGWKETDKIAVERKVKDLRFMKKIQTKLFMRLGVKSNKLQKHFRPQVNF